jgi:hypothetical protein
MTYVDAIQSALAEREPLGSFLIFSAVTEIARAVGLPDVLIEPSA